MLNIQCEFTQTKNDIKFYWEQIVFQTTEDVFLAVEMFERAQDRFYDVTGHYCEDYQINYRALEGF